MNDPEKNGKVLAKDQDPRLCECSARRWNMWNSPWKPTARVTCTTKSSHQPLCSRAVTRREPFS